MKESVAFQLAVNAVIQRDPRFCTQAYAFLCEALNYTVKRLNREEQESRHVTGQELLVGFREFTLTEFGPLSWLVMTEWGIQRSEDVGTMVYNLIEIGYFGRNDKDSIHDFSDGVDMEDAFVSPFRPQAAASVMKPARKRVRSPKKKAS